MEFILIVDRFVAKQHVTMMQVVYEESHDKPWVLSVGLTDGTRTYWHFADRGAAVVWAAAIIGEENAQYMARMLNSTYGPDPLLGK